jgi:tetratricopeptide (TPR) repeat protein
MRYKFILFIATIFITLAAKPCGKEYYFNGDMELPIKDGFLDYYKIFISSSYSTKPLPHNVKPIGVNAIPYWTPFIRPQNIEVTNFVDKSYEKLKDSLMKIMKVSYDEIKLTKDENLAMLALQKKIDYKLISDFAWKMARNGNYKAAERILLLLIAKHPNEYNLNANIGTVYELLGKNELALQYINKAMIIDPNSHYGSEWIHIKILEQKLDKGR